MQHLGSLSENKKSLKENECGRLKGYFAQMEKTIYPIIVSHFS